MAVGGASKTNDGTQKGGDTSPATPPGIDDPEVIIARRNAEHRRMQASFIFHQQTHRQTLPGRFYLLTMCILLILREALLACTVFPIGQASEMKFSDWSTR